MSGSNCCFLTSIQISQEGGKVVWYSHLFKNFPHLVVIHTIKAFSIVNEVEIDVFLNSLASFMIQWILAIWSLFPLPFLNPVWTSWSSRISGKAFLGEAYIYLQNKSSPWPSEYLLTCMHIAISDLSCYITMWNHWLQKMRWDAIESVVPERLTGAILLISPLLTWHSTFKKLRSWHQIPPLHANRRGQSGSRDRFYFLRFQNYCRQWLQPWN